MGVKPQDVLKTRCLDRHVPMSPRIAIASTLRNAGAVLDSFIRYHLAIGFDHLFLFFDDPEDSTIDMACAYDGVSVFPHDDHLRQRWTSSASTAAPFAQAEVMARQVLNLEVAIGLALDQHIDWLLHIDADELFYAPDQSVKEHFAALTARNVPGITYVNYEAVPEQVDIVDYFKEATLFKKVGAGEVMEGLNDRQRALAKTFPQIPLTFFHFYRNGKSAARVQAGLQPGGVHRFRSPAGKLVAAEPGDPLILHYPCCGFKQFWDKFITLEHVYEQGRETWWGRDVSQSLGSFYSDACDVVGRRDEQEARTFYRDRYVISDEARIKALIENDLCCRIRGPARFLRGNVEDECHPDQPLTTAAATADPPIPATLLDGLFDAPAWHLHEVAFTERKAFFFRVNRDFYTRVSFLGRRVVSEVDTMYRVPLMPVLARFRACAPLPRPMCFIFHTAFCGSTLLSRCLDRPGVCLAYREPRLIHQLSAVKRQNPTPEVPRPTPLLDVALALFARTYSASEVPLIKPTDSCINLAREVLTSHPASAGLLLYAPLEAFLLSMLKNRDRRRYLRRMIRRARHDLDAYGRLPGLDAEPLPDARVAAFVWIGLMVPYLDLLADEDLRVRSLEASVFYQHPEATLEAAARFFGLGLTPEDITAARHGIFTRHAKAPDRAFDKQAYDAAHQHLAYLLADEIRDGLAWAAEMTRHHPIPDVLPRPLLA